MVGLQVYMDVSELGWQPYVKSWRERRKDDPEHAETLDRYRTLSFFSAPAQAVPKTHHLVVFWR